MLYIVTMPECKRCAARLAELTTEGRAYVEVNGDNLRQTKDGTKLPHVVHWALVTELAFHGQVVPVEVEMSEA